MNARDDETDREQGFLGRWIRRKAQVQEKDAEQEKGVVEGQEAEATNNADRAAGKTPAPKPAFDLSTLPRLDEINAQTNITDFMRREVPAALRNAALRQAWAIDPAIRDYVNPAREYAYDWNVPGGVPGNGPIEAGFDALKQVAEAFSKPFDDHTFDLSKDTAGDAEADKAKLAAAPEVESSVRTSDIKKSDEPITNIEIITEFTETADAQLTAPSEPSTPRRRHGGAAPV